MKTSHYLATRRQQGLAISVILLAVALLAAIAITIALSSRGTNTNAVTQQDKLNATTIIQQGNNIATGFQRMASSNVDPAVITFDAAVGTGLWNPSVGGTVMQIAPSGAKHTSVAAGDYEWVYKKDIQLMNVGTSATADYVVLLTGVSANACRAINNALYGTLLTAAPPTVGTGTFADFNTPVAPINLSADGAVDMKPEQCVETATADRYVYYKAVLEN